MSESHDSRDPQDPPGRPAGAEPLSHIVHDGQQARSRMVDVSAKASTARSAEARAEVLFPPGVLATILAGNGPKGPIEEVARSAGILAAKRTGELIPLCHPLGLDHVEIDFEARADDRLGVSCFVRCQGRTGVEMEALTGASVAALTIYDMTKALHKGIEIRRLRLLSKTGGKSGTWRAADD